jgi:hypothetical protein
MAYHTRPTLQVASAPLPSTCTPPAAGTPRQPGAFSEASNIKTLSMRAVARAFFTLLKVLTHDAAWLQP